MKILPHFRCIALLALLVFLGMAWCPAAEIRKANNYDQMDLPTSWIGGIPPGSADVAVWDSGVTNSLFSPFVLHAVGTNVDWSGIAIRDPQPDSPGVIVEIDVLGAGIPGLGATLNLGAAGIDMTEATEDVNLIAQAGDGTHINLASNQTWNIGPGRFLVAAFTNDGPGSLTKAGPGALTLDYALGGGQDDSHIDNAATLTLGGGTLLFRDGTHTELVGGTVVAPGANLLGRISGFVTLVMNGLTRNVGGTLDFGSFTFVKTSRANDASSGGGILGGWATAGLDWAQKSPGIGNQDVVPFSGAGYSTDFQITNNVSIDSSVVLPNTTSLAINSLRLMLGGAPDLSLTVGTLGAYSLTNLSGGILSLAAFPSIVAANPGATLRGPAGQDLVFHVGGFLTNRIVIADNAGCGLTKALPGTLILDPPANNTYTGPTRVNEGTLMTGNTASRRYISSSLYVDYGVDPFPAKFLHGPSDNHLNGVNITLNGGILDMAGRIDACNTLSLSNHALFTGYAPLSYLIVTNLATNAVVSGSATVDAVLDDWGGLLKQGRGTLEVRHDSWVYGPTVVQRGNIQVDGTGSMVGTTNTTLTLGSLALGAGTNSTRLILGGTNGYGGATLIVTSLVANANSGIVSGNQDSDSKQVILNFAYDTNFDVGILGAHITNDYNFSALGLTKDGSGTLTLTGTRTYVGPTTNLVGTLRIGNGGAVTNAPLVPNFWITSGTLDLNGNSISALLGGSGTVLGGVSLSSYVLLTLYGSTFDGTITENGSTLGVFIPAGGDVTFHGNNFYSGYTYLSGHLNVDSDASVGGGWGPYGGLVFEGGTLNIMSNRSIAISDQIVLAGNGLITGGIAATNFGLPENLVAEFTNTLNGSSGTLVLSNGAPSMYPSGSFQVVLSGGNFTFGRPIVVSSTSGTTLLSFFNTNGTTQTFTGPISGDSWLYRHGPFPLTAGWGPGCTNCGGPRTAGGTTILAATNTYTGGTWIADGTLLVNGAISSTNYCTVGLDLVKATLGGNGLIRSPVLVVNNGILSPGTSIGRLTISNSLTLVSQYGAGTCFMELSKNGSTLTNDSVVGVSTLVYGGTLNLTNIGPTTLAAGDTFKLFSATNYTGSFTNVIPPTPGSGLSWDLSSLATNGTIRVVGASSPQINGVSLSGTNVLFSGSGGSPHANYYVLTSTNVAVPVSAWDYIGTNTFDGSGNFTFTNAINLAVPQRFYIIQLP